jgi:hypothetical protein
MSRCPGCWDENGRTLGCQYPNRTCGCDFCEDERWWLAHPIEAAERDYEEAEAEAQRAEESGYDDAYEKAQEAGEAYRYWEELREGVKDA